MTEATWLDKLEPAALSPDRSERWRQQGPSCFSDLIKVAYGRDEGDPGRAVLFTGIESGCGVSHMCSCIAAELSQGDGKVLLVDAEVIDALAGLPRPESFCERIEPSGAWVLGRAQLQAAGLDVSPLSGSVASVLRSLQAAFASIVIDAPAVETSHLALNIGGIVHGVVFVARAGQTETRKLTDTCAKFRSLGAKVLGSVYNAH